MLAHQVKSRQLWGEDIYTDDSDLVAVLLHLGYYASNNTASNPLVARFYAQVGITCYNMSQRLAASRSKAVAVFPANVSNAGPVCCIVDIYVAASRSVSCKDSVMHKDCRCVGSSLYYSPSVSVTTRFYAKRCKTD